MSPFLCGEVAAASLVLVRMRAGASCLDVGVSPTPSQALCGWLYLQARAAFAVPTFADDVRRAAKRELGIDVTAVRLRLRV